MVTVIPWRPSPSADPGCGWLARVFLPPAVDGERGRQVGKVFRGRKKAVKAEIAQWEADLRGTAPGTVGTTVADLLTLWQEAKAFDWQPTTIRDQRSRCAAITRDLGTVRLLDLDPFKIDAWMTQMRRRGVGEGAVRSRVGALRAALSWGMSRRMLRSNPVVEAAPRVRSGRRTMRPDPEQVVALLAAAREEGTRAFLGLRLAAVTGARAAEVVALGTTWTETGSGSVGSGTPSGALPSSDRERRLAPAGRLCSTRARWRRSTRGNAR